MNGKEFHCAQDLLVQITIYAKVNKTKENRSSSVADKLPNDSNMADCNKKLIWNRYWVIGNLLEL